jgi:hypothetical protein
VSLAHISLPSYYQLNFVLHRHDYSTEEVENWLPYERDIYVGLLLQHLEKTKNASNAGA